MAFVHALPHVEGELIGRDDQLVAVRSRLRAGRASLLVGPPGVGKTALAIRAAEALAVGDLPLFDGGEVASAAELHAALARCPIGAPGAPLDRRPIVVLDGLDHLDDGAWASLIAWLDRAAVRATLTSRAAPRIARDLALTVPVLDTPAEGVSADETLGSPAVLLLLDHGRGPEIARLRAMAAGRRAVDEPLIARFAALARALDGLPLSLKLAASKLEFLSVTRLLDDLVRGADILRPARRTERGLDHLLMAACDDVSALARSALRACAILAGPFDIDAAQQIVGDPTQATVHALHELVRAGLIARHGHDDDLLVMLKIVRVFALRDASEQERAAALDRREAMLLHRIGDLTTTDLRDRNARLTRVAGSADDLWAAADRALRHGRADAALRLLAPAILARVGRVPGAVDRDLIAAALAEANAATSTDAAYVHVAMAELERTLSHAQSAIDHAQRAVAIAQAADARTVLRAAYAILGSSLALTDRSDERLDAMRRAADLARADGDGAHEAMMQANIAMLLVERGEIDEAVALCLRALDLARASEAGLIVAYLCEYLGYFEILRGRSGPARRWIADAQRAHASFDPHRRRLILGGLLAECDELDGDDAAACRGYAEVADGLLALADNRLEAVYRCLVARVSLRLGDRVGARAALDQASQRRAAWDAELRALVPFTATLLALCDGDPAQAASCAARVVPERPLDAWMAPAASIAAELSDVAAGVGTDRPKLLERATALLGALRALDRPDLPALRLIAARGDAIVDDLGRIWIAADGSHVDAPTGERTELPPTSPVRSILGLLAERYRDAPGEPVTRDQLIAAGWPGERLTLKSGSNRVYVALSHIRKAGVADALLRRNEGWLLSPDGQVLIV